MKSIDGPSKIRIISLMILVVLIVFCCLAYRNHFTYNSIKVVTKKSTVVEYGSANYDINNLIKKVEGEIVSIKNEKINTNVVGDYEVILKVKKDNVVKDVPIVVSVVDTVAPVIQIKEETVTITQGDDYDLTWNVESVTDDIDGEIYYSNDVDENSVLYYNFGYNPDEIDNVGSHEVSVHAKDSHGNLSIAIFTLVVEERKYTYNRVYSNAAPIPAAGDVVSLAYAYLGYPYAYNGKGPYAFDCSGFVHYLYSQFGIYLSGSTWGQLYEGVPVSYESAVPGDILLWGNDWGVSHSALYVGNGQMIHAANPSQGVILSDVDGWRWGSGTYIVSVRRVQ